MAADDREGLRALIRLIAPAQALKDDLDESINLERYQGTGDMALKTYRGLQKSVAALVEDPYVESLAIDVPEGASEKEKVSLARLGAGQLLAYLEGQTGIVGLGRGGGGHDYNNRNYHMAPSANINMVNLKGVSEETIRRVVELGEDTMKGKEKGEEEEG